MQNMFDPSPASDSSDAASISGLNFLIKWARSLLLMTLLLPVNAVFAVEQTKGDFIDKFRQLGTELPTPNVYRNAAG